MLRAVAGRRLCIAPSRSVEVWKLGTVNFTDAWALQRCLHAQRAKAAVARQRGEPADSFPDVLLVLQHPSVYTMGRGASTLGLKFDPRPFAGEGARSPMSETVLAHLDGLASQADAEIERCSDGGQFSLHRCDRGGQITWHGPGQVVVYPVLDLGAPDGAFAKDLAAYVHGLEDTVIGALGRSGIPVSRMDGYPGVWTRGGRKIAALGASASRWVTLHGLSVNVDCDLAAFDRIVPCGIEGRGVTSAAAELPAESVPSCPSMESAILDSFQEVFGVECVETVGAPAGMAEATARAGGAEAVAAQRAELEAESGAGRRFDVLRAGTSTSGDLRERR